MGCDIHLYAERRVNGVWETADRWTPDEYADKGGKVLCVEREHRFYTGRNYNLFAILADVRNGRGFAGIKTGEGYNPISEPRGLPDDACALVRAESDSWDGDGHSHSWLTVAELMAYDWTQVTCLQGWVSGPSFYEWNRWKRGRGDGPETYSGAVCGNGIKHVELAEMERMVAAVIQELGESAPYSDREKAIARELGYTYCLAEWTEPYFQAGKEFLYATLPRLWRIGEPADVRIVFWFDN